MSHRTPTSCTCTRVWRYRHQRGSRILFAGDFRDGSMSGKVLLRCSTIPFLAVLALPPPPPSLLSLLLPALSKLLSLLPHCLPPPPPLSPRSSVVFPTTSPFTLKQKYRQHSFSSPQWILSRTSRDFAVLCSLFLCCCFPLKFCR